MQYYRVGQPVSFQEFHISKNCGSHCSQCFVELFNGGSYGEQLVQILAIYQSGLHIYSQVLAGATVSNFTISNFAPPPIISPNEVAKVLARATVIF